MGRIDRTESLGDPHKLAELMRISSRMNNSVSLICIFYKTINLLINYLLIYKFLEKFTKFIKKIYINLNHLHKLHTLDPIFWRSIRSFVITFIIQILI